MSPSGRAAARLHPPCRLERCGFRDPLTRQFDGRRVIVSNVRWRAPILVSWAITLNLSGCLSRHESAAGPTYTVRGVALAGPVCPVVNAASNECDPRPVAGSVEFLQGDRKVGVATLDGDGRFSVPLHPGTYTVHVRPTTSPFPVCRDTEVVVADAKSAQVSIDCDTGIR